MHPQRLTQTPCQARASGRSGRSGPVGEWQRKMRGTDGICHRPPRSPSSLHHWPTPPTGKMRTRHSRTTFPRDRWGTPEDVRPCRPECRRVWPVPRPHPLLKHELCQVSSPRTAGGQGRVAATTCGGGRTVPRTANQPGKRHLAIILHVVLSREGGCIRARRRFFVTHHPRLATARRPPDHRSGRIAAARGHQPRRRAATMPRPCRDHVDD